MRSGVQMQKQVQLAFTGYSESNVRIAVDTIVQNSAHFDITVNGNPIKENGLIVNQPNLRGCDNEDLKVYSLSIEGALANAKELVRTKTPLGVQIDLLPSPA